MSSSVKTYWPVPNADTPPPPDGPIAIGTIIPDPKNPARSLNKANRVPIPADSVLHSHKNDYHLTREESRQGQGGLWASFLESIVGVTGDAQVKRSENTIERISCRLLETQAFQPDDTYIYVSLQDSDVQEYLDVSWFESPVYMITGLKIARGVSAETVQEVEYKVKGKTSVNVAPAGVPGTAGPSGEWVSKSRETAGFTGSSDFVWAYRLIRIYKRKNDDVSQESYNKGALYGLDESEKEDSGPERLRQIWDITSFDDPAYEVEGVLVHSTTDEHGETCKFVASGKRG